MSLRLHLFLLVAALVWNGRAALAHDFWIVPSSFNPEPGTLISLTLLEGEHGEGATIPRENDRIERFSLAGPNAELRAVGLDGADPAGVARVASAGLHIAVYHNRPKSHTLEPARFEAYLIQEGLESVVEQRHRNGQRELVGREQFERCAKALVRVGSAGEAGFNRVVGLPLEIVPEDNPWTTQSGTRFRVQFQGQSQPDVMVTAFRLQEPGRLLAARADADGRVSLPIDGSGVWLIKCVQMAPASTESGADWHSFWGSLTFERI